MLLHENKPQVNVCVVTSRRLDRPDWDALYGTALEQEGHFTTEQAQKAGYSPQLLAKYLLSGKVARVRRGVYRIKHFPAGQQEELVVIWLWSERAGVFSHETALTLHELSDILPSRVHLTVPATSRRRRLRVPEGVVLHYAHVAARERTWIGAVPVTSVPRALADCTADHLAPDLLSAATAQALTRGLIGKDQAAKIREAFT